MGCLAPRALALQHWKSAKDMARVFHLTLLALPLLLALFLGSGMPQAVGATLQTL